MRGVQLAGASLAREGDQMLGDDARGDDFLDPAFLQAWPGVAPECPTVVREHAELPAHLGEHGDAAFQVLEGELARSRRALAAMRIGAADLVIIPTEQPCRIVGML